MSIKLEMLRCFEVVAKSGSLIDAAEKLGRTPSAVSMMLKQFEEIVGQPLFETARKSKLSPFGEMVYREAKRELDSFDRTIDTIENMIRGNKGLVRLAVTPSVATIILPKLIKSFVAFYPDVGIDVRDMDSESVRTEMEAGRADIGIATTSPISGMEQKVLFSDRFGVVCTEDDPLTENKSGIAWEQLVSRPFISNGLCKLIEDEEFTPILASSRLSVPNTASLIALVKAKVGITLLPRLAIPVDVTGLKYLPVTDCETQRHVSVISKPARSLLPTVQAFLGEINKLRLDIE